MYQTNNKKTTAQISDLRSQMSGSFIFCFLSSVFCLLFSVFCFLFSVSFAQDEIIYDEKGRRDPFIALVTPDGRLLNLEPAGPGAKVILEGIIYDKVGRCYAIINGEVVSVGDYIFGYSVLDIKEDRVTLMKDNENIEYKLRKEEP